MAETTLKAMAAGGLFDHIGGGFSRYATDDKWLIPHFEKMLYDNTLLLIAYLSAYQFTGDAFYAEVARRTADYMLRNFIRRKAAFSAARTRTVTAWRKVLHVYRKKSGVCWVRRTRRRFAVFTGSHRPETLKAQAFRTESALRNQPGMEAIPGCCGYTNTGNPACGSTRTTRFSSPGMAGRLLRCVWRAKFWMSRVFATRRRTQRFIEERMTRAEGRLFLRYRDGEAAQEGQLDDYTVYAMALLALYRATFDPRTWNWRCAAPGR